MTDTEIVKVFGGPGTGKTTTMVTNNDIENYQGILERKVKEEPISDVMLIAYTRSAADEAKRRLAATTRYSQDKLDQRITTIHSLTMGMTGIYPNNIVEIRNVPDKYHFCNERNIEYSYDDSDDDDMMDVPDDAGHQFFQIVGWLKSSMLEPQEWSQCPIGDVWAGNEYDFVALWHEWEDFKNDRGIYEFDDVIRKAVDEEYTIDARELFVDEVQDLYPLQQAFLENQKVVIDRLWLAGDDDQCLPPDAEVDCKHPDLVNDESGTYKQDIKDVEEGDLVRTMVGDGEYKYMPVKNVIKNNVIGKTMRRITTSSGKTIRVTDNHKMFARLPNVEEASSNNHKYLYLMRDDKGRYRIGQTTNLRQRFGGEPKAKELFPLTSVDSKTQKLILEEVYSLNYSIPKVSFNDLEGSSKSSEFGRDQLYSQVEPDPKGLADEMNVDLDVPTMTSGSGYIRVNMNYRHREGKHKLTVHPNSEDDHEAIRANKHLKGVDDDSAATGYWAEYYHNDLRKIGKVAENIQSATGYPIKTQMYTCEGNAEAKVIPSSNLVEGMYVPVVEDGKVVWDQIITIDDREYSGEVYDLTVKSTHNFTVRGVGVHNTIYEWAGADPTYFLNKEAHVDEVEERYWEDKEGYWESDGVYILNQSFRMPSQIMELSQHCIERVSERQDKEFKPHKEGGNFHYLRYSTMSTIEDFINHDSTFCLFRTNRQCQNFGQKLIQRGIPFEDRFKTWRQRTIDVRDAIAALYNSDKTVDGDAVAELISNAASDQFSGNNAFGSLEDDYRNSGKCEVQDLENDVRGRRIDRNRIEELVDSLDDDNFNYYQKEAIKNNVFNDREHLDPDGLVVETIHWSKGQEADTVILGLDTTPNVGGMEEKAMPDAERRLYYVGMTRTENTLVLGERLAGSGSTFTAEDLFGEDWEEVIDE